MSTAQQIAVVYGAVSVAFGMLLGLPLSQVRMAAPEAPRHLVVAHLSALMQGTMHFGIGFALGLSNLTPWLNTAAVMVLALGSMLFVAGATANWLQGIGDHFAVRSPGWWLLAVSGGPHIVGSLVLVAGVVSGAAS